MVVIQRERHQSTRLRGASPSLIASADKAARSFVTLHNYLGEVSDDDSALNVLSPSAQAFLRTPAGRLAGPIWAESYVDTKMVVDAYLNRSELAVVPAHICRRIDTEARLAMDFASRRFGHDYTYLRILEYKAGENQVRGFDLGPEL